MTRDRAWQRSWYLVTWFSSSCTGTPADTRGALVRSGRLLRQVRQHSRQPTLSVPEPQRMATTRREKYHFPRVVRVLGRLALRCRERPALPADRARGHGTPRSLAVAQRGDASFCRRPLPGCDQTTEAELARWRSPPTPAAQCPHPESTGTSSSAESGVAAGRPQAPRTANQRVITRTISSTLQE